MNPNLLFLLDGTQKNELEWSLLHDRISVGAGLAAINDHAIYLKPCNT